jgi:hypothetical protein
MKNPMKFSVLGLLVAGLLVVFTPGCDLSKQVTAKTVAVSTVLVTPAVTINAEAIAGGSLPGFDGGLPFDAGSFDGSFPFDAGGFDAGALFGDGGLSLTLPSQTVVYVFFGQRQGDSLDVAPVGTAGVNVTLSQVGGGSWKLADQGGGNYALLGDDAGFVYKDNATYDFTMELSGTTYVAEVTRVPAQERIAKFHEGPGYLLVDAGADLTFTRVEPSPQDELPLGFVNVFPVGAQGSQGQPTYTNVPKTPLEFLKLVVVPNDWKKLSVTIPGSAFPEKDHNYIIVLQSAKLGGPKSDNLFTGSAILAGTADLAIVKTRP